MIYPNLSVEVNFDVIKIPGFYKVKLVSPRVQELEHVLDNDRYIIPGKFKNYAFEMFDRVLGTDGIRQGRRTKSEKGIHIMCLFSVLNNLRSKKSFTGR